ncbi:MAG: carbohydrate-binding domain-containing protein [Planctomycetota bacterium]|jgi:hypothetical protein
MPTATGFAVYAEASEWLEYTCDILPGTYTVTVRSSSSQAEQTLTLSQDGQTLTTFSLPTTGGFRLLQLAGYNNCRDQYPGRFGQDIGIQSGYIDRHAQLCGFCSKLEFCRLGLYEAVLVERRSKCRLPR